MLNTIIIIYRYHYGVLTDNILNVINKLDKLTQLKLVHSLLLYNNQHIIFYSLKWYIHFNKRVATVFRS